MIPLHEMSYEEFARLRFLDHFPTTDRYVEDGHEPGGLELESAIGRSCVQGYGTLTAFFGSPVDAPWQTAEIALEFDREDFPVAEGNAFLAKLGLPLEKGIGEASVRAALGVSDEVGLWPLVVGDEYPYYLGCAFSDAGLSRVWICRKDLADEETGLDL
jgi:hypothetical protein